MVSGHNPHDKKKGLAKAEVNKKVKCSLVGILDDVCKQEKNDGTLTERTLLCCLAYSYAWFSV